MKIYKFDKLVKEAIGNKYQDEFDKMLTSRPEEKYYKTSVKNYSDSDYLRIIWRAPLDKLPQLIDLLEKDRRTAIELGRPKSVIKQLYKKDKLNFDSRLKWAKETLNRRTKGEQIPDWLSDKSSKEQLVDEIRELTRKMAKMVDENFGYAPDSNQFDSYLDERGKKLEELKALDSELYTKMIDEI